MPLATIAISFNSSWFMSPTAVQVDSVLSRSKFASSVRWIRGVVSGPPGPQPDAKIKKSAKTKVETIYQLKCPISANAEEEKKREDKGKEEDPATLMFLQ